jgi:hypothetical protein
MAYTLDHDSAMFAGYGKYISESGNYVGYIRDAIEKKMPTGSKFFNIKFESDDGLKSDYISICTGKKDGTPAFGAGYISALIGLLKINSIDGVQVNDGTRYTELIDRRIAIGLQRENYTKKDGYEAYRMNVTHFYHPDTHKTYSETKKNESAKTWESGITEKQKSEQSNDSSQENLPF